jgi:protein-S-isoprenylcysteine O-methyltransferase Ste14
MVGSFVLYGLFLIPGQGRSSDVWVLGGSDMFLACGMIWALYSLTYLGNRFSIVPEARGLVTSGPYRLVRHPIYSGILLAGVGTAVALSWLWLIAIVLASVYFAYSATVEERYLTAQFPDAYPVYKRSTKMLVPFVF